MAYKISLSNKAEIQIDRDELEIVTKGIEAGVRLIKVRSGMFNPSFIVSIEPDYSRLEGAKGLPKELPDMFNRIGSMKSFKEITEQLRLESNEPQVPREKIKEFLVKPDFLKNIEK